MVLQPRKRYSDLQDPPASTLPTRDITGGRINALYDQYKGCTNSSSYLPRFMKQTLALVQWLMQECEKQQLPVICKVNISNVALDSTKRLPMKDDTDDDCFTYSIAFDDFSCPSGGSTPSATALAGYSYSQGCTTPLGYLQYNLTYFSPAITSTRTAGPLLSRGPSDLKLVRGESVAPVGRIMGVKEASIRTIKKSEATIGASVAGGTSKMSNKRLSPCVGKLLLGVAEEEDDGGVDGTKNCELELGDSSELSKYKTATDLLNSSATNSLNLLASRPPPQVLPLQLASWSLYHDTPAGDTDTPAGNTDTPADDRHLFVIQSHLMMNIT
ncbi:hypothetical protein Hamer_G021328 [Homarus americanus]|uniref:Uncharacterized protein n=1 Tax=Homarus americanus TaxID=6706 RepID=A0A8J5JE38_HOMAM|nr:hypothetical protein Hamer_G021328 [Homarus americanus]